MQYRMYSKIKALKMKEESKQESALKKRNILAKKGEISKINDELRMIFIHKKQKSLTKKVGSQKNVSDTYEKILLSSSRGK